MSRQDPAPTSGEDKEGLFQEVREVFAGRRLPLTGGPSKVLRFMLDKATGCDATINREGFTIVFGEKLREQEYFMETAPGVISQLLTWAGVDGVQERVRAVIGPDSVPPSEFVRWSFGRRLLWIDVKPDGVTIHIRDGSNAGAQVLEEAPEPFPSLPRTVPCPYCGMPLRTALAKQCRHCRRDWHDPNHIRWLGNNTKDA
jgi:hypothetical protein